MVERIQVGEADVPQEDVPLPGRGFHAGAFLHGCPAHWSYLSVGRGYPPIVASSSSAADTRGSVPYPPVRSVTRNPV